MASKMAAVSSSINGTATTLDLDALADRLNAEMRRSKEELTERSNYKQPNDVAAVARWFLSAYTDERKLEGIRKQLQRMAERNGLLPSE